MSTFDELVEEYLGDSDALTDINVITRRLWFYDFVDYPTRMWAGQGRLFTEDGNEWLGTMLPNGGDIHTTPRLQDGRDGSSASYQFSMVIPDIEGTSAGELYNALKSEQDRVYNRTLTCYLAVFKDGEGLRPTTPIKFFKRLTMFSPLFSEKLDRDDAGRLVKTYTVTIKAKDDNYGRSKTPNRLVNDACQREYARQMGVTTPDDLGCEYVSSLANKTFTIE